jgi:hypothetical protein
VGRPTRGRLIFRAGRRTEHPRGGDEVGESHRLGDMSADHGSSHEAGSVRPACAHDRQMDRWAGWGDREQPMPSQQRPAPGRVLREPRAERRVNAGKVRAVSRHGEHRDPQRFVDPVEVEDVEPADHDPVQDHGLQALEAPGPPDESDHLTRAVPPVDANPTNLDRLDPVGSGDRDRGERRPPSVAAERAVVHADDPHVQLLEFCPQR